MKIFVKVKPKSRKETIKKIDETNYAVSVKEAPEKGRATDAVRKALAKFLGVAPSRVVIAAGETSKFKTFEIPNFQ